MEHPPQNNVVKLKRPQRKTATKTQKTFPPTPEQQDCVDKAKAGENLIVRAYAGCGKTTTLTHMANAIESSQIYLAFSKAIVTDAKKVFPTHCKPMTLHGMAFREIRPMFDGAPKGMEKMTGNINPGFVAWKMKLRTQELAPTVIAPPRAYAFLLIQTVKRWIMSGAREMGPWCVPIDGALKSIPEALLEECKQKVLPDAWRLWERMSDPGMNCL